MKMFSSYFCFGSVFTYDVTWQKKGSKWNKRTQSHTKLVFGFREGLYLERLLKFVALVLNFVQSTGLYMTSLLLFLQVLAPWRTNGTRCAASGAAPWRGTS